MTRAPSALMLFAAGFGTRMRPLTDDRPKPLIEVAGRSLADHALDQTRHVGLGKIVANLHYKPELLAAHLAARGVETVLETPDILDTGGGLRNALPLLGEGPVFTLNTDAVWAGRSPLAVLRDAWDPARMDALLCLVPVADARGYRGRGDFTMAEQGSLSRGPGHVYGGAQIVKTDRLGGIDDKVFSLNRVWDAMQRDGRLYGCIYQGKWCDVGHPGGIATAEDLLAAGNV